MRIEEITGKLDKLFEQGKGPEAQKLLEDSIRQAVEEQDDAALLTLLNEMIGYTRETSQVESSYQYADAALKLMDRMELKGSIAYATTLLNIANAYRAGGRLEDSLARYEEVLILYNQQTDVDDMLYAGLYNNMSLLYQEMGNFKKAQENLFMALVIVSGKEDAYFEEAVTCANLATTCLALNEDDKAAEYFKYAISIFESHDILDAHYCAALSAMGTYYYKKKAYQSAAAYFEKAMNGMKAYLGENEYYHRLAENLELCRKAMQTDSFGVQEGAEQQKNELTTEDNRLRTEAEKTPESRMISGLALCRAYYEAYGRTMIHEQFAAYEDKIAVGLVGEGSDCFRYDDAVSRDHDWGPGFCMWVSDETYAAIGEELQSAYKELPDEFQGYTRRKSLQGQDRVGVCTVKSFYERILGKGNCPQIKDTYYEQSPEVTDEKNSPYVNAGEATGAGAKDMSDEEGRYCVLPETSWTDIPDEALAAATNGEVFTDREGIFSAIRNYLKKGYPERIWYLKLSESCARFSQGAQYNFDRMAGRGEKVAAALAMAEGVKHAMKLLYYTEREYPPHDKWLYRGLKVHGDFDAELALIEQLLTPGEVKTGTGMADSCSETEAAPRAGTDTTARVRCAEELGSMLADRLYAKDIVGERESYLDVYTSELVAKAAFASYSDAELVDMIAETEFEAFDKVRNAGGRASCQNDWYTFSIMRKSQYMTWNRKMLIQYLYEFKREYAKGRNLITEKYGRMMESTAPAEYAELADSFPVISPEKKQIIEAIVQIQVGFMEEFAKDYPHLAGNARLIHTYEDEPFDTSYETYLRGEISTYSDKMLELYGRFVAAVCKDGKNLAALTMENSVHLYGYQTLADAEAAAL